MSAGRGVLPLPATAVRVSDWLDELWSFEDLAPAPAVRRERSGGPACVDKDPNLFFPRAWEITSVQDEASPAEREALAVCAGCPVQSWCLARDLEQSSTTSVIIGVRGGMRQSERRALHQRLAGLRSVRGMS